MIFERDLLTHIEVNYYYKKTTINTFKRQLTFNKRILNEQNNINTTVLHVFIGTCNPEPCCSGEFLPSFEGRKTACLTLKIFKEKRRCIFIYLTILSYFKAI